MLLGMSKIQTPFGEQHLRQTVTDGQGPKAHFLSVHQGIHSEGWLHLPARKFLFLKFAQAHEKAQENLEPIGDWQLGPLDEQNPSGVCWSLKINRSKIQGISYQQNHHSLAIQSLLQSAQSFEEIEKKLLFFHSEQGCFYLDSLRKSLLLLSNHQIDEKIQLTQIFELEKARTLLHLKSLYGLCQYFGQEKEMREIDLMIEVLKKIKSDFLPQMDHRVMPTWQRLQIKFENMQKRYVEFSQRFIDPSEISQSGLNGIFLRVCGYNIDLRYHYQDFYAQLLTPKVFVGLDGHLADLLSARCFEIAQSLEILRAYFPYTSKESHYFPYQQVIQSLQNPVEQLPIVPIETPSGWVSLHFELDNDGLIKNVELNSCDHLPFISQWVIGKPVHQLTLLQWLMGTLNIQVN